MPRRDVGRTPGARALAHEVLVRVETTDAYADVLLADRLGAAPLDARDRALATRLVYGTLAWQGRLDHHLGTLLDAPLATLEPGVRAALRLGLYQILFFDRVPAYAAVDASVGLARRAGRGAAGLVNAVLRRAAAAGRAGLALPDARDPIQRLAVEWSHPPWLVERWARALPPGELPRLLAAHNEGMPTALRTNRERTTREALAATLAAAGIATTPGRWAPDALLVERGAARLRSLAAWRDGAFSFQGEASQLVTPLLALEPGAHVLDVCAAPGGKATHAAALVGGTGLVAALDRRLGGVRRLEAEAARLGARSIRAAVADARRPPIGRRFDAVLVDAPCTGLGTLGRHPELRWRRRPEDVQRLAALQADLLGAVAPLVRPGGVVVYAVCTLTREENEGVIEGFLREHRGFAPEPGALPEALRTPEGHLRSWPHRHGIEGFFAARLRAAG